MSKKKKLGVEPSEWDATKPWFYNFYGHEKVWARRFTARKNRRLAKQNIKKGRDDLAGKDQDRTGGWLSW